MLRALVDEAELHQRAHDPAVVQLLPEVLLECLCKHHHGASRQHLGKHKFVGGIGVPSRVTDCSNASIERKASAEAKPSMVAPLVSRYVRTPFSSSL